MIAAPRRDQHVLLFADFRCGIAHGAPNVQKLMGGVLILPNRVRRSVDRESSLAGN